MQDTDNGVYSAADAAKELETETEESTDQTETTAETEESTTTDVTADEDATDEEDDTETDEEDLPELPELDSKLKEALGDNAEALELWERQWKGIAKRERRLKDSEDRVQTFAAYEQGLTNKETAPGFLNHLISVVEQQTGLTKEQLLGLTATDNGQPQWEQEGYYSEKELELARKQQALEAKLSSLESAEAKREQEKEEKLWLDRQTPKIAKTIEGQYDGFKVTPGMVKKAIDALPQFKDEPARAVEMFFARELVKHASEKTAGRHKKLPEMLDTSSAKGFEVPSNLEEYSAAHAALEVSAF
jgi:hypothetical protein